MTHERKQKKMQPKQTKRCPHCTDHNQVPLIDSKELSVTITCGLIKAVRKDENGNACDHGAAFKPIRYCPMCGRKM